MILQRSRYKTSRLGSHQCPEVNPLFSLTRSRILLWAPCSVAGVTDNIVLKSTDGLLIKCLTFRARPRRGRRRLLLSK